MSMTITQPPQTAIIEQAAPEQLILRLHINQENSVRTILKKIQEATRRLPHEHQEEVLGIIQEWEQQFFTTNHIDSPLDSERIKAAHALLFLRSNTIEYIMLNYAVGDINKITWLEVYNELKDIVTAILPSETNVETFIEADKQGQLECLLRYKTDQTIKEVMQQVNAIFDKLECQLYESADLINKNLQVEFEAIKKLLLDLNKERTTATEELHEKIDELTKTVTTIYQELERQLKETQELGKKIDIQEGNLAQLLNTCEAIVNNV